MQTDNTVDLNAPKPHWDTTTKVIVTVILMVLLGLAIYFFRIVFVPLIIGSIIAYLLHPVVRKIRQITRLPHKVATTLLYLFLLTVMITLGIALSPLLATQAKGLANELTAFVDQLEEQGSTDITILGITLSTQSLLDEISASSQELILSTAAESISLLPHAAETALLLVFTLLTIFYLTRDAEQMLAWTQHLIPPQYHQHVGAILAEIDRVWAAFFRGQVILALVVTIIMTVICTLLGLPQPLLLGILAGVLEFLPSIGHTIWVIIAMSLAIASGSTWLPIPNHIIFALLVAGAHLIFTQFDLNYLIPRIIGEQVRLHPLVIIGGIIIGWKLGGVLGITLAAPTIATLRILGRYIYALLFDVDPYPSAEAVTPSPPVEIVVHPAEESGIL
ncbi:MAG: AI-2E family transporter [Anaerolineae bacterium]|nr:AI-2E family transporter [Anaerolineae bacterium]